VVDATMAVVAQSDRVADDRRPAERVRIGVVEVETVVEGDPATTSGQTTRRSVVGRDSAASFLVLVDSAVITLAELAAGVLLHRFSLVVLQPVFHPQGSGSV
jgi:hypothetical protein